MKCIAILPPPNSTLAANAPHRPVRPAPVGEEETLEGSPSFIFEHDSGPTIQLPAGAVGAIKWPPRGISVSLNIRVCIIIMHACVPDSCLFVLVCVCVFLPEYTE